MTAPTAGVADHDAVASIAAIPDVAAGAVADAIAALADVAAGVVVDVATDAVANAATDATGIIAATATGVTFGQPLLAAASLVLFASLATLAAAATATTYRWYFREKVPEGIAVLAGVAIVALYLNTTSLGAMVGGEELELLRLDAVVFNVVAIGVAAVVSPVGLRVGDAAATNVFAFAGVKQVNGEVSRVVRTVGRVTAVTIPAADDIEDMDTYEPVAAEKKAEMAGKTVLFPRRLTVEQLHEQLVARVKEDFSVGYVDVDLTVEGTIEYFAVGSRAAGIGPTLPPGATAIAVRADPPNSATPGDTVQVWRGGDAPERVATAELRATAGDVTTLVLDESDAEALDDATNYRLVTLPAEPQADREFASLLRAADETMSAVIVAESSDVVGRSVTEVSAVVAAVQPAGGTVEAIPSRSYTFAPGDTVYLVGRPDALRRFESEAGTVTGVAADPDSASKSDPEAESTPGSASKSDADAEAEAESDPGSEPGRGGSGTQSS